MSRLADLDTASRARCFTPEESAALFRELANQAARRARVPARIEKARRRLAALLIVRLRTARSIDHWRARIAELEAELYPEDRIARIERELRG